MSAEKFIFALLVCALAASLAFLALGALSRQPTALFAYGSNLAKSTMNARAGGFINATAASLQGYSLSFASQDSRPTEFGVATLLQNASNSVPGALYYLTPEQLTALDKQMGAPNFYGRKEVAVALPGGSTVRAQAYSLSGTTHSAPPSRPYYLSAQAGLAEWGYGNESIDAAMAAAASN